MAAFRPLPRPLDPFDRAILRIVQCDNRMPQRAIAEAVNLSTAAVQRRIAAMEKSGVIARNAAIVAPDMRSYEATTRRLFAENAWVASYHSYLALDRVKAGMELVIP
ncbi:winged helix-turn-helix transcriptional regulator [Sphingobium sp. BYY-5]|uniref:Lrp/AsnC family transcriptional regulator n=1 Tax=Sphingobium sp. BYY-5 TaxID=2926400 RepID=UPI001FA7F271|nr:winged helix-turn-helix transcriptional regulator [Sphingobium sp. BYY-5]MCI4591166.1 winged helix-turn-helix transcriptional regulator [Sphingobium sp. BYY-5]